MPNTFTVTIGGTNYPSYADLDTANTYLAANITATAWAAATDDAKGAALVTATRLLDRQAWLDAYNTFDLRKVNAPIVDACCELAALFVAGTTDALDNVTTAQTIKSLRAGTVALDYFRADPTLAARFPVVVQELLAPYLGSAGADAGVGYAGGTDRCSAFESSDDRYRGYGLTRGL